MDAEEIGGYSIFGTAKREILHGSNWRKRKMGRSFFKVQILKKSKTAWMTIQMNWMQLQFWIQPLGIKMMRMETPMFANNDIKKVFTHFEIPLRSAVFSGSVDYLMEEWQDLIEYTVKYLKPATTDYHKCWYNIFNCSMSRLSSFYSARIEHICWKVVFTYEAGQNTCSVINEQPDAQLHDSHLPRRSTVRQIRRNICTETIYGD